MIKEWFRDFYGFDFLKELIDDSRRDISKMYGEMFTIKDNKITSKMDELAETCKKVDLNNEDAIKFILHHLDVSNDIFQRYKYFKFEETPWYIQELLLAKHNIQTIVEVPDCVYLYYKGKLIGCKDSSHIGELLDNIEKVDNELSNK